MTILLVLASILLSAVAQVVLKFGMTTGQVRAAIESKDVHQTIPAIATSPYILIGMTAFGLSALLWLFVLSRIPLSTAYPMMALGIVLTVLAGRFLLLEPISASKAVGVGLIIVGVVLVGSKA